MIVTTVSILVAMPVDWRCPDPAVAAARDLKELIERGIEAAAKAARRNLALGIIPPSELPRPRAVELDETSGIITVRPL
jgi:hypothetical protein